MRSIELIKGLLKRFDLLAQFFALFSLHLKASVYLLTRVQELLLGVLFIIIITPTIITFTIIITHIIFYLVDFAMRHVDGVSKMEGLLLMAILASAFLRDFLPSSLESSLS
jgi:hypothetical protein